MFNTFKKCCGIVAMFALYLYSAPAAFAQCDDGSIELNISFEYDNYPGETSWYLLDASGATILSVDDGGAFDDYYQCVADGACYTLVVEDYWGDGGPVYTVSSQEHGVMVSGSLLSGEYAESNFFCAGEVAIPGCTSEVALNFDANATEDDGSCTFITPSCSNSGTFCYSSGANMEVVGYAAAPEGDSLYFHIISGNIEHYYDQLYVFDSFNFDNAPLLTLGQGAPYGWADLSGSYVDSPTGIIVLAVDSDGSASCSSSTSGQDIVWEANCYSGCLDPDASNYDPFATVDDGSCEYIGCTDATACNFDIAATTDDGSCEYSTCAGCMDETAENYDSEATISTPCTYCSIEGSYCYGNTPWAEQPTIQEIFSYDNGGGASITVNFSQGTVESATYDQMVIYSSLDQTAESILWQNTTGTTNLAGLSVTSPTGVIVATIDSDGSGSCQSSSSYVPMEWTASWACEDLGCTDAMSCNYDEGVSYDDGTCDYSCIGCMDNAAANFDPTATLELDGSCIYCDAGTFVMTIEMGDAGQDGWNGATYVMQSLDGSVADITGSAETAAVVINGVPTDFQCIPAGCYQFFHGGGTADGENTVTLTDQFGTLYADDLAANILWEIDFGLFGTCGFEGCTDSDCFNFNPSATIDDGSCVCPPPNDAIETAEVLPCGATVSGTLANATDVDGIVGTFTGLSAPGVWYILNADNDYQVFANTCGTGTAGFASPVTDTKIHVFELMDDGSIELIVNNDDACGAYSNASFLTTTGTNYLIHVSPFSSFTSGSEFELELDCELCEELPANDFCEFAQPQLDGVTFTGDVCCTNTTLLYTPFGANYGVWFTMNSQDPVTGYTFDSFYFNLTNVSSGDLTLSIFDGDGDCETISYSAGCNFTGTCAGSVPWIDVQPNTDYYFFVGTTDPQNCGSFEFTTQGIFFGCMDPLADNYLEYANEDDGTCEYSIVPENDVCEQATVLECDVMIEASMGGATPDSLAPNCFPVPEGLEPCTDAPFGLYPGATFTPSCTGSAQTITTCGFAGEYSNVNVVAGATYMFSCNANNLATAATQSGEVLGFGIGSCVFESTVTGTIRFYESPADNCGGTVIACTNRSVTCGPDVVVPNAGGVWFTFEGTGELHNINTCGSIIDTRLALYTAPSATACADLTCATDEDGALIASVESFLGCGFFDQDDASLDFISEIGTTYFVYVTYDYDGVYDGQGSYNIEMTCETVVEGCNISAACNYNPDVNVVMNETCEYTSCTCADNPGGSTVVIEMYDDFGDGWVTDYAPGTTPGGYVITDLSGAEVASGSISDAVYQVDIDNWSGPEFGLDAVCLDPGCYIYTFNTATLFAEEQYWAVYVDGSTTATLSAAAGDYFGSIEESFDYSFGLGGAICGCTDDEACNYDMDATDDNGTCEYETCAGCTDDAACTYDPTATILDLAACCYDNCVTITLNSGATTVYVSDLDGDIVDEVMLSAGDAPYVACLASDCYIVSSEGSGSWTMSGIFGLAITGGADFEPTYFSVGGSNCVYGCNVLCACNYNEAANILDIATCSFDDCAGCTYDFASNYYPLDSEGNPITEGFVPPSVDDGSCVFELSNPCPADINEDGNVTTADLLVFLGAFGTVCE